jgi:YHS domain-containing protein
MLRWVLFAILFLFIVRALSRLMSGVLEGAGYRRDDTQPSVKLVRDPVCGMFVVRSKALTAAAGGDTKYFCSEKCQREWSDMHR